MRLSKGNENTNSKDICTLAFVAALFTVAKLWKQFKHPLVDEGIKKIHTMENYSVGKKEEILPFVMTWMNLDGIK